ncbi:MAG: TRAP transporter substrate-binding protein [Burkholderiaceae bacterium]|nr:TRAP transporter substrate-binding protein [Burkholderiaceae bacterium]
MRRRRRFLLAGAAASAAIGRPAVAREPAYRLRFQSVWPAKDIFHEFANDFARKVSDMTSGRLRIDMLPAGAVVRPFDVLDAVHAGQLDGGHASLAYWAGKNSAMALWGSGPALGMDPNMVLAWHAYGGGRELLEEIYRSLNLDVVSFVYGPMPTQPLGWFKRAIKGPEDLRGLRFRTVGLSIDMFTEMGAVVQAMPAAEIAAAMDRGLLDAAEFNNPTSDRILGLTDVAGVCMLRSFHQSAENFQVMFNRAVLDRLPDELETIIGHAVQAASADMSWKAIDRYSSDYEQMASRQGVRFEKTPDSVLQAQLDAWDIVAERKSRENPMFRRVQASMREFAERAATWQNDTLVDYRMAWEHYFKPR